MHTERTCLIRTSILGFLCSLQLLIGAEAEIPAVLRRQPPPNWTALLNDLEAKTKSLESRTVRIALDQHSEGEERIGAVLALAKIHSDSAMSFLLQNIDMTITKKYLLLDDDRLKERPCFYSLATLAKWRAVPHVLSFLEQRQPKGKLDLIAELLIRVCGHDGALAILQLRLPQLQGLPSESAFRANLTALSKILAEEGTDR